jgi:uncharacterized protein YukE
MQFFRVEPAALRRLSAAFQAASASVSSDAAVLGAAARLSCESFGPLPEGLAAGSQYERKLDEALQGLAALQATMEQVAANLESTAGAYAAADQANLLG